VISSDGALMDSPSSGGTNKNITNVAAFAVPFRLYQRKENKLSE